jgi:hypothetical protein
MLLNLAFRGVRPVLPWSRTLAKFGNLPVPIARWRFTGSCIPWILLMFSTDLLAQTNACDLNNDAVVNVIDAQLSVNMYLGLASCTSTVDGAGVCNTDVVQKVETAALGGTCVTHSVTLNWTASTSGNISGYNVYRSSTAGGPYTKVNSSLVSATIYTDSSRTPGQTYYYVATAVDINNNESGYSNQAQAVVPTP